MQCDVYRNADDASGEIPYLLDVQANLLSDLKTRVVVPLIRAEAFGQKAVRLHPGFTVDAQAVVMGTHLIAAVSKRGLGEVVVNISDQRDAIISAIDVLWSGVQCRTGSSLCP
jgi:toxin CcdB